MIAAALVLASLQTAAWSVSPAEVTVGDTVRLVRRTATDPTVQVRLEPLIADAVLEPLADPVAGYAEGTLTIVYILAVFEAGSLGVAMPPMELLYPDGRAETLEGDTAWVNVASVLPPEDSLPPPMPLLEPLPRPRTTLRPLITLLLGITGGALAWGAVRRRKRPRPSRGAARSKRAEPPIDRWVAADEPRAVAAIVADRLREIIAALVPEAGRHLSVEECLEVLRRERPGWPIRDLGEVLHALERARFAPAVPAEVMKTVDRVEALVRGLDTEANDTDS